MAFSWFGCVALSAMVILAPLSSFGQVSTQAQQVPAVDPLQQSFAEMMTRPGDPDLAVRYARLAASQGDSRAAIIALERVLRINPSLDNIRLEISSIYLAAGSADLAAVYAKQALASPAMPPDVAARARQIAAMAERGSARSLFDINLFAGVRHDTNANGTTPAGTVFLPAALVSRNLPGFLPFPITASGKSDWSSVLGARFAHRYDLELQREGTWETNGSLYDQRFARIARGYNLTIASVDTGPRIGVAEIGDTGILSLRPFASAAWIGYANSTYGWLYGGGLTAELRLPPRWTYEVTALSRFGNYMNSGFRPRARDYTGGEFTLNAAASYALTPATRLTAAVSYSEGSAGEGYYNRSGVGASLGASTSFLVGSYQFGASARAGVRTLNYKEPDPQLNPFAKRQDIRWEAGGTLIFPVAPSLAVTLEYDWFDQRSNYQIYRFDNHALTVGLRLAL